MQAEVLTRTRAERDQSFGVRLREMLSDRHLLWPALGASMAVVFCLCGVFAVMQLATAENPDSLAAMLASAHPGSDDNPLRLDAARLAPRVVGDAAALGRIEDDDAVFAVATGGDSRRTRRELRVAAPVAAGFATAQSQRER
jgi:hypothetical protein